MADNKAGMDNALAAVAAIAVGVIVIAVMSAVGKLLDDIGFFISNVLFYGVYFVGWTVGIFSAYIAASWLAFGKDTARQQSLMFVAAITRKPIPQFSAPVTDIEEEPKEVKNDRHDRMD